VQTPTWHTVPIYEGVEKLTAHLFQCPNSLVHNFQGPIEPLIDNGDSLVEAVESSAYFVAKLGLLADKGQAYRARKMGIFGLKKTSLKICTYIFFLKKIPC
jgi:hypothetical protein